MSEHSCALPDTGFPGDRWTCPDCGKRWFAYEDDDAGSEGLFITWDEDWDDEETRDA